jgi:hypothetical protein
MYAGNSCGCFKDVVMLAICAVTTHEHFAGDKEIVGEAKDNCGVGPNWRGYRTQHKLGTSITYMCHTLILEPQIYKLRPIIGPHRVTASVCDIDRSRFGGSGICIDE